MKKLLLRYGFSLRAAGLLVGIYLWLNSWSPLMTALDQYRIFANAFTLAGVLLLGLGALVWVSTTGFFDGLGYALKHLGGMLIPGNRGKELRYSDYKEEMAEKHKAVPVLHLLLVGLLCMALTALFMVKFYAIYEG